MGTQAADGGMVVVDGDPRCCEGSEEAICSGFSWSLSRERAYVIQQDGRCRVSAAPFEHETRQTGAA